jgi:hypothetical protein
MTDDEHYVNDEDDADSSCPPHLLVLCALCGYDVCEDCEGHFDPDGEELDECPGLTDLSSSPPPAS